MRHQCRAADFDTESAEARAKPNRPVGRLMSAQASADPSKLGRCHLRRHQPSGFSASPASRKFALRAKDTDESKGTPLRVFRPKGELPCRIRDRKPRQSRPTVRAKSCCRTLVVLSRVNNKRTTTSGSREGVANRPLYTYPYPYTYPFCNFLRSRSYTKQKMWFNIQRRKEKTDEQRTEQRTSQGLGTIQGLEGRVT